jgi:hypothetical protein
MALREFTDHRGNTWRVWETRPASDNVRPELLGGWLTFEQGEARRRLAPIPERWAECSELELRRLCSAATLDRRRRPPG